MKNFNEKFGIVLNMSDPDFPDKLREAIGLNADEKLEITTPSFNRTDGKEVTYIPRTKEEYEMLPTFDDGVLQEVGCQIWDRTEKSTLWLYPAEWYEHIPDGINIIYISGKWDEFKSGVTDNDMRFGALPYGFLKMEISK